MTRDRLPVSPVFRVWVARCDPWQPKDWRDVPPHAVAVEPLDARTFSHEEAALLAEGFNGWAAEFDQPYWAVALAVIPRFEGDARPGDVVVGHVWGDDPSGLVDPDESRSPLPLPTLRSGELESG